MYTSARTGCGSCAVSGSGRRGVGKQWLAMAGNGRQVFNNSITFYEVKNFTYSQDKLHFGECQNLTLTVVKTSLY